MIKKISNVKNKPKEPPQIAINLANKVFVIGIFVCVLIAVYALYKIFNSTHVTNKFYIISVLCCGVFAALFGFGLKRFTNNLKVNLSLLLFVTGITVYGFETYLEFSNKSPREKIAKKMGVQYDKRSAREVLQDLMSDGVEVYPNIHPLNFVKSNGLSTEAGRIYPLGGISNSTTIFGNEAGYFPIIKTDEHGFNNPKGLYIANKVDIVLIGDSFTEGCSVNSDENIGAVLRQLNFNTISVGKSGSGPLTELAALKEYAEPLKPKIVLWVYFAENDLGELKDELASSILTRYLNENDYSQNLISRQEEIDGVLINYAKQKWKKDEKGINKKKIKRKIINLLKLYELRAMISLTPTLGPTPILGDILKKSKQKVLGWGGQMYFVYLPARGYKHPTRDFVIETVKKLDIPIIDIQKEVFDPHPDTLSLFPLRILSHYNAEGYKLVAEAIGERLKADGF